MRKSLLTLLAAVVCAILFTSVAAAQDCGQCYGSSLSCDTPCWVCMGGDTIDGGCSNMEWITCGQARGNPENDLDSDGVDNSVDNCTCTANASQANCDGDGFGDACDSVNANYVYSHDELCMIDRDTHFGYFELERHFDRVYVDTSSCHAPNTYDTYEDPNSAWCYNISTYDCCRYVLEESEYWCNRVNQDFCQGN